MQERVGQSPACSDRKDVAGYFVSTAEGDARNFAHHDFDGNHQAYDQKRCASGHRRSSSNKFRCLQHMKISSLRPRANMRDRRAEGCAAETGTKALVYLSKMGRRQKRLPANAGLVGSDLQIAKFANRGIPVSNTILTATLDPLRDDRVDENLTQHGFVIWRNLDKRHVGRFTEGALCRASEASKALLGFKIRAFPDAVGQIS